MKFQCNDIKYMGTIQRTRTANIGRVPDGTVNNIRAPGDTSFLSRLNITLQEGE